MAFDYDKIKAKEEGSTHWATYSDLFMVLSLVFLLLYVVSSLRTGTMGVSQQIEAQVIAKENADLKEQLRVYDTLKSDYLKTGSTEAEQKTYENLMGQLDLLKEEAKSEKSKLEQQALQNAQKAEALNEYQQLVRNIINSNLVAQARLKKRETIIGKQDVEIETGKGKVEELSKNLSQKEAALKAGQAEIEKVTRQRDSKVTELKKAFEEQKITKENMENQVALLQLQSAKKLQGLRGQNKELSQEVSKLNSDLNQASEGLNNAQMKISELESKNTQAKQKMKQLQAEFNSNLNSERENFEKEMKNLKLSSQERAEREKQFREKTQSEQAELNQKLGQLQSSLKQQEAALNQAENDKSAAQAQASQLKAEKSVLTKDLKKMTALAEAKKRAIGRIKSNLQKAGLDAQIDGKTGDVIISFGEEYFEVGQAALKEGMRDTLKKFIPIYSKSLLEDPKTADKISSVEIVGFASPTYKGKFVDPVSLQAKDREAVNYNLDLSYYRARSIFDHIFDTSKMKYKYQKDLLPLVKVTGRSFLAEENGRDVASEMSVKDYCAKFNCKKAQKVIIRFDMQN